jgi:hypothetical protein
MVRFQFNAEPEPILLTLPRSNSSLEIERTNSLIFRITKEDDLPQEIRLEGLVNQLIDEKGKMDFEFTEPESMMLDTAFSNLKVRIYFSQINYNNGEEQSRWSTLQGIILLKEF